MRWISWLGHKYENQYRADFIWKYAEENGQRAYISGNIYIIYGYGITRMVKNKILQQDNMKQETKNGFQIKGSMVHVAPACVEYGEGSNHFGSSVRSLSLHFYKRLFQDLNPLNHGSFQIP
jgi:hypothetical protein